MAPGPVDLLFYRAHGSDGLQFVLRSNSVSNLFGTIYLSNGDVVVDTSSRVADKSAYFVTVAYGVRLMRRPDVVFNTNHSAIDVPVPRGLGPTGDAPQFIR